MSSLDAARVRSLPAQVHTLHLQPILSNTWQLPPAGNSEFISALLRDLVSSNPQEGQVPRHCVQTPFMRRIINVVQVTLGLSDLQFKSKWGDHYTRSLLSAHRLQQCHNYKVFNPILNRLF